MYVWESCLTVCRHIQWPIAHINVCISFCVFQVDKLQQADAERAEEMQDQQPPPMMSE